MGDRPVIVTVKMNNTQDEITIKVDQEPVDPGAVNVGDHIDWAIRSDNNDWAFTQDHQGNSNGIDIKGHGKQKFKDKGGANRKQHKWQRTANGDHDGKRYRYTISVVNETATNGPITLTWDPSIMNN